MTEAMLTAAVLAGANPSAEEGDDEDGGSGGGETVEKVPELVTAFGLEKTVSMDKDYYKKHLKSMSFARHGRAR